MTGGCFIKEYTKQTSGFRFLKEQATFKAYVSYSGAIFASSYCCLCEMEMPSTGHVNVNANTCTKVIQLDNNETTNQPDEPKIKCLSTTEENFSAPSNRPRKSIFKKPEKALQVFIYPLKLLLTIIQHLCHSAEH